MAIVGNVIGGYDTNTRHWRVTITGVTATNQSPVFSGKGYPIGTAVSSGTITTGSLQWWASNDGVTFAKVGAAITTSPLITVLASPDNGVFAFYYLDATALSAGGPVAAVIDFVSQNAS